MGRFETACNSYLTEEKIVGHSVNGHFLYLNPSKDEIERVTYETPYDVKGFRGLYFFRNRMRDPRLYVFTSMVTHDDVERYLEKNFIEDADDNPYGLVTIEYKKYLGKILKTNGKNTDNLTLAIPRDGRVLLDIRKLVEMLHLPPDTEVKPTYLSYFMHGA